MAATYRPLIGSTAYRVCLALVSGSDSITEDAIAAEDGKPTHWVSAVLADAVSSGWLRRQRDADRRMVYLAGPALTFETLRSGVQPQAEAAAPAPAASKPAMPPPFPAPKARRRIGTPIVNFEAIKIRSDAPPPERVRAPMGRWHPLLDRMKPGDWFDLPRDNHAGARKAVGEQNKRARPATDRRVWQVWLAGDKSIVACRSKADAKA